MWGRVTFAAPALALAFAATASAGTAQPTESLGKAGGLEYLRTKYPDVVTQAGPTTTCDAGDQTTGGGAAIGGRPDNANLNSSGPTFPADAWVAEGQVAQGARTVTGWAICSDEEVTDQSSNDTATPEGYNAGFTCNTGQAMGGGVVSTGGANVVIRGMFPAADPFDWVDSIGTIGGGSTQATTFMLCSAAYSPKYRRAERRAKPGRAPKVIARCSQEQVVAGGGLKVFRGPVLPTGVWAVATRPWDSEKDAGKTPDDGWLVKSYNDTNRGVDVKAFATCVPR